MTTTSMPHNVGSRWIRGASVRKMVMTVVFNLLAYTVLACPVQSVSDDSFAENVSELKAKAQTSGKLVRVIVEVRPTPTVKDAKAQLTETMRRAGVILVQPIEGTALIVMELSAQQIDRLLSTGMVQMLQEDKPEPSF